MDTGHGTFRRIEECEVEKLRVAPTAYDGTGVFCVGQEVEMNGSRFRVKRIGKRFLTLQLLPKKQ